MQIQQSEACGENQDKIENEIGYNIDNKKYVKSSVKREAECKYVRKERRYRRNV